LLRLRRFIFAGALIITASAGVLVPAHAQTGYGDDTVPPRSLTVDSGGKAETAGSDNGGGSNTGTIIAIVVAGGALLGAGLYGFLKKPGSAS
jgi:hypothetical protein